MKYLLMIYCDESIDDSMPEAEMGELIEAHGRFAAELGASGAMLGGERLRPVATATSVTTTNGEVVVTDGPFAETKEQLGGFYMIEAATLDEAIAWAKKIPCGSQGTVEVRPVWSME